uniref:Transcription repressor n=1 Tax=Oryza rufipogon TaxID=4529 RepID=A0A0E0RE25_ORYRU
MSTAASRARRGGGGGGGRHFPVGGGRWRHVPVVDTGCGCRPRRPRQLLMSLPSFLRPSALKPPVPRSTSSHSSSFFPSSASTASFSSSSAATYTILSLCLLPRVGRFASTGGEQRWWLRGCAAAAAAAARRRPSRKKRYEKMAAAEEEEDVGVAVEKESSDPRADFRESMVQMVVEMGLCGWDDLRCMLRRLLALNAPRHHAAILTAFAEVCAQLAAPPAPAPPPPPQPTAAYHYHYYHY